MRTIQRRFAVSGAADPRDRYAVPCARCAAAESISLFANDHVVYWHCPECRYVWVARGQETTLDGDLGPRRVGASSSVY